VTTRAWTLAAASCLGILSAPVIAQPASPAPASTSAALPAMGLYSSVERDELVTALKATPAFANIDGDLPGSPFAVVVTHSLRNTAAGNASGFFSALIAGTTLGLLPVVTNRSLVVTYEIRVNGHDITSYTYEKTYTRAVNIWAEAHNPSRGLGKDGLDWIRSTALSFAADASKDAKLAELVREYDFYFSAPAP
jgi:hypothetical protein